MNVLSSGAGVRERAGGTTEEFVKKTFTALFIFHTEILYKSASVRTRVYGVTKVT